MKGLSAWFFGSALAYAVLGLVLGNVMGASGDHSQMPTHAHLMLIGWVSFAIFGFFYHLFAERAATLLARIHFWLAQTTYIALVVALYLIFSGQPDIGEPIAAAGAVGSLLAMLLFALIALPVRERQGSRIAYTRSTLCPRCGQRANRRWSPPLRAFIVPRRRLGPLSKGMEDSE